MSTSKSLGFIVGGTLLVVAAGYQMLPGGGRPPGTHGAHGAMARHALSTATPLEARAVVQPAVADGARMIRLAIAPDSLTPPGVYRFHKGDVVDFRVTVPYDGALAVHGYTTGDVLIAANHELRLPLKLDYTGRFPMHVHAHGGQHIEVAVLEILPD